MRLRRQPPAYSPVTPSGLWRALQAALGRRRDSRRLLGERLCAELHADGAVLTGTGTHALQVALEIAHRLHPERVILLPAFTCYEVATAAVAARVRVALYDLDPDTLEPDADSVRMAAGGSAAALVVSPLYGMPLDLAAARTLARELDAVLIEDAAQAAGVVCNGRPAGSHGDLSVLSFGRGKGRTGMGGGALLWRGSLSTTAATIASALTARRPGLIAELGIVIKGIAQLILARPTLYGLPAAVPGLHLGETIYHEPTPVTTIARASAALALATEAPARLEGEARARSTAEYAGRLDAERGPVISVVGKRAHVASGALRFPIRVRGGWHEHGGELLPLGAAPVYPTPLDELDALRPHITNRDGDHAGARTLVRELITLPTHSRVSAAERRQLIERLERPRPGTARDAAGLPEDALVATRVR